MHGKYTSSLIFSLLYFLKCIRCTDLEKITFLMPNVHPDIPETYLCTALKMDNTSIFYITGFEANATMHTAHHMILFSCSQPGSNEPVWECGEMQKTAQNNTMPSAKACADKSEILYAWSHDAPKFVLPSGVGFKMGKGSLLNYLVLQVHYSKAHNHGSTDNSGIVLHITKQPLNKLAGVIGLATNGGIPPHSVEHMETACDIIENKTLHPFAYRIHTHALGKLVSGYVIKNNKWMEIGKRDPQKPQMFYDVHYNGTIVYGDKLAARCTMKSERDTWTYIGNTHMDEMCNFYVMYYVENDKPLKNGFCLSPGPPSYYWHKEGLINIPDYEASTL